MGNFEKLVVLTVLFLSAVVLAVSLSSGDDEDPAQNPLADAKRTLTAEPGPGAADPEHLALSAEGRPTGAQHKAAGDAQGAGAVPPGHLAGATDGAGANPVPVAPAADAEGHPRVLRTRQGLSESPLPNYMVYTAAEGDTWAVLADRFYRSASCVALLQAANEDLAAPKAGDSILVPVFDFRAAPQDRAPRTAAPARPVDASAKAVDAGKPAVAGGTSYTVVDGDNLWKIAEKVYGSGARWMEIFEANKDVMKDADSLKIGMALRIPPKR